MFPFKYENIRFAKSNLKKVAKCTTGVNCKRLLEGCSIALDSPPLLLFHSNH